MARVRCPSRVQPSWPQFQKRVESERTNCPRKTLTEGQLEMLRRRAGGASAMCDAGTAIPAGMLTEPSYKATGTARECGPQRAEPQGGTARLPSRARLPLAAASTRAVTGCPVRGAAVLALPRAMLAGRDVRWGLSL